METTMSDLNEWADGNVNAREKLLLDAERLVNGARNVEYGNPNADFLRTATMWTAYLEGVHSRQVAKFMDADRSPILLPHDVAAMMVLLKVSRIAWSPTKRDHWLDLAGHAACGADCVAAETTRGEQGD